MSEKEKVKYVWLIGMRNEKTEAELEEERVRESKRLKECWKEVQ